MDNKKFVDILIEEVYEDSFNENINFFNNAKLEDIQGTFYQAKKIYDNLDNSDKKAFLDIIQINIEDTIAIILSIIDEWGGGYFNDGKDNDGHFELYYVSDEEDKYKYRVDEDTLALFLERMEEIKETEDQQKKDKK